MKDEGKGGIEEEDKVRMKGKKQLIMMIIMIMIMMILMMMYTVDKIF